ncbi:MAG: M15 family metallopeptidase [Deltaproteobacteria bacterium]|nr:M15 family metallopeptidase [Deltaproteobacteria bacterium]
MNTQIIDRAMMHDMTINEGGSALPRYLVLMDKLIQLVAFLSRPDDAGGDIAAVITDFIKEYGSLGEEARSCPQTEAVNAADLCPDAGLMGGSLTAANLVRQKTRPRPQKKPVVPYPRSRSMDPKGILTSGKLAPVLCQKIKSLLVKARKEGLNILVLEGYRSLERQKMLYQSKAGVTRAAAGQSLHNYGLAADVVFYDSQDRPSWSEGHNWQRLGEIGKELGLVWGGDFKSISDKAHFEYHPGMTLREVKKTYRSKGMAALWQKVGCG